MNETETFVIAIILMIIPFFDWTAFTILHRASRASHGISISERSKVAGVLAIVTSLNATVAANRVFELHLGTTVILILLSISLLLVSVPNIYWLSLYFRSRMRKDDVDAGKTKG